MPRKLDHVEAAKEEAARLGATIELTRASRHIKGVLAINGKQRKIFLSTSTVSGSVCHVVREDVRRKVREMTA